MYLYVDAEQSTKSIPTASKAYESRPVYSQVSNVLNYSYISSFVLNIHALLIIRTFCTMCAIF